MPGPAIPQNSGKEFYNPGAADAEYNRLQNQPELPSVPPPTGGSSGAPAPEAFIPMGPVDPDAPDILELIKGGEFKPPFTVTLMRREGMQTFKSDAGTKTEAKFVLCKETVRTPSDLLRLSAGVQGEAYKSLNNMTLEFQLMLYLAYGGGTLNVPPKPVVEETQTVEVAEEAPVQP
jgi:hypothetical protein